MIVLDASVVIAFLDRHDAHHPSARSLLIALAEDELGLNTVTLAEVLVGPARTGRLDVITQILAELDIRELAFPADAARQLALLRASTGLKLPDCCVLVSALDHRAKIATFDTSLLSSARAVGVDIAPVEPA